MSDARVAPDLRFGIASAYAVVGLLTATVVHASTYTSFSMKADNPLFWILHIGIFPIFILMVSQGRKWRVQASGPLGRESSRFRWRDYLPPWAMRGMAILIAYAVVNLVVSISHLQSSAHGSSGAVVNMTPEQARYLVRAFSGHWLIFYAVPMLFFLYVPRNPSPVESERRSSS